ncbi:phosphatase PAP2 family protein [Brevibacillus composti]|uniref:Phosphatase PAP2 family protein n=1 Tax=Brevibacillus composti TaxID=2796470 RepID=A0A7T5JM46_9BACL|nr:phosphatase PAP2 family protein [Brevibacillus composti]QQE72661.1 phosphatase PAP2 family protein [Brevibacillus composti]QUO39739.1 phosphatase PAP2 family protein [Brevibacillus composti]
MTASAKRYFIISFLFLVLFLISFLVFAHHLIQNKLQVFDQLIIAKTQAMIHPQLTSMMKFFTFLGDPLTLLGVLLLAALTMFRQRKRWEALFLTVALAGGALFNWLLKWIFQRERPTLHRLIEETGYSFPSGHSMNAIILYGMIGMLCYLFLKNVWPKLLIVFGALLLILLIGNSRIYLGVHYPSDVAAGFAAGGVWLVICLIGLRLVLEWRSRRARQSGPS